MVETRIYVEGGGDQARLKTKCRAGFRLFFDIFNSLKNATCNTQSKGKYGKASHSFDILSLIDPVKVCNASSHANIFITLLKDKLDVRECA